MRVQQPHTSTNTYKEQNKWNIQRSFRLVLNVLTESGRICGFCAGTRSLNTTDRDGSSRRHAPALQRKDHSVLSSATRTAKPSLTFKKVRTPHNDYKRIHKHRRLLRRLCRVLLGERHMHKSRRQKLSEGDSSAR